jgi:hypothetical protein
VRHDLIYHDLQERREKLQVEQRTPGRLAGQVAGFTGGF